MYLIIGIGNPKKKYEFTRHNAGFMFIDWLAEDMHAPVFSTRDNAVASKVTIGGQMVQLSKSLTFMNSSGEAVKKLADYFDITPENIVVVHDDIDLPLDKNKLAFDRGSGGHNGIKSVINKLGTKRFNRLRLGIAESGEDGRAKKPDFGVAGINPFVMGKFENDEIKKLEGTFPAAKQAVERLITEGREAAQNYLH